MEDDVQLFLFLLFFVLLFFLFLFFPENFYMIY